MKLIYIIMAEQSYGYDVPVTAFVTRSAAEEYVRKYNSNGRWYKAHLVELFLEDK